MSWQSPKLAYSPLMGASPKVLAKAARTASSPNVAFSPKLGITSNNIRLSPKTSPRFGALEENYASLNEAGKPTVSQEISSGYLYGQLANVAKMAVWWSVFSPLIIGLLQSEEALGYTRLSFNLALVVVSPIAGVLAERIAVRRLLNVTTATRMVIWVVLIPVIYVLLKSELVNTTQFPDLFYGLLLALFFFDGASVAMSNVVDIDCGGLDLLGQQHEIEITDHTRNKFNSTHQMVFDASFIFFAPLISFLVYETSKQLGDSEDVTLAAVSDVASLLGGMAAVFLCLSFLSLYYYNRYIPSMAEHIAPTADVSVTEQTKSVVAGIWDGAKICFRNRPIGWRLFFLALETALEDSMVSVCIAAVALNTSEIFADKSHAALGNLWCSAVIAVGKVGAFCAGLFMNRFWHVPEANHTSEYRKLFWSVFLGGCSVMLLPVSHLLVQKEQIMAARVAVFAASFLFFMFSTAPKIGFATLLQGLAAEEEASGKIFGFVATFVTAMDAIIILVLSSIFKAYEGDMQTALWISASIFAVHGVLELLLGPWLVLGTPTPTRSSSVEKDRKQPLLP